MVCRLWMGSLVCRHAPLDPCQLTSKRQDMALCSSDSLGLRSPTCAFQWIRCWNQRFLYIAWQIRTVSSRQFCVSEDLQCGNALQDLCAARMALLKDFTHTHTHTQFAVPGSCGKKLKPLPINIVTVGNGCCSTSFGVKENSVLAQL